MHADSGNHKRKDLAATAVAPALRDALGQRCPKGELACAVAFAIARELDITPARVGMAADRLDIRLIKCQLGLFGYLPEKKIVRPAKSVPDGLRRDLEAAAAGGRLSCKMVWQIAARLKLPKMRVAGACEALQLKIKPCQLGAF
jgi:hypothetical protein